MSNNVKQQQHAGTAKVILQLCLNQNEFFRRTERPNTEVIPISESDSTSKSSNSSILRKTLQAGKLALELKIAQQKCEEEISQATACRGRATCRAARP